MESGHKILFEGRKIITLNPHYHQKKIREAIEIIKQPALTETTATPTEYLENGHTPTNFLTVTTDINTIQPSTEKLLS